MDVTRDVTTSWAVASDADGSIDDGVYGTVTRFCVATWARASPADLGVERACVWCERKFTTLEGVRGHMRDKQHVKIKFEPPVARGGRVGSLDRKRMIES